MPFFGYFVKLCYFCSCLNLLVFVLVPEVRRPCFIIWSVSNFSMVCPWKLNLAFVFSRVSLKIGIFFWELSSSYPFLSYLKTALCILGVIIYVLCFFDIMLWTHLCFTITYICSLNWIWKILFGYFLYRLRFIFRCAIPVTCSCSSSWSVIFYPLFFLVSFQVVLHSILFYSFKLFFYPSSCMHFVSCYFVSYFLSSRPYSVWLFDQSYVLSMTMSSPPKRKCIPFSSFLHQHLKKKYWR